VNGQLLQGAIFGLAGAAVAVLGIAAAKHDAKALTGKLVAKHAVLSAVGTVTGLLGAVEGSVADEPDAAEKGLIGGAKKAAESTLDTTTDWAESGAHKLHADTAARRAIEPMESMLDENDAAPEKSSGEGAGGGGGGAF